MRDEAVVAFNLWDSIIDRQVTVIQGLLSLTMGGFKMAASSKVPSPSWGNNNFHKEVVLHFRKLFNPLFSTRPWQTLDLLTLQCASYLSLSVSVAETERFFPKPRGQFRSTVVVVSLDGWYKEKYFSCIAPFHHHHQLGGSPAAGVATTSSSSTVTMCRTRTP